MDLTQSPSTPVFIEFTRPEKAGEMTVIQKDGPDNYRVLDEIHTHYGAHTLTVDPVSHRVFVAYASLLVHPRIAVFSPAR